MGFLKKSLAGPHFFFHFSRQPVRQIGCAHVT